MGFDTIDPLIFMKVYFSNHHLFTLMQMSMFLFFEKINTKGYKSNFQLNVRFSFYFYEIYTVHHSLSSFSFAILLLSVFSSLCIVFKYLLTSLNFNLHILNPSRDVLICRFT